MTLVLHYAPDNASLIVRLALDEAGLPFATRLVDRSARAQDSAAYRAVNPAGLIPALETPDGALFETAAILLWISETSGRLAPAQGSAERGSAERGSAERGSAERGEMLSWLFFVANTLHAQLRMTFYPEKYVGRDVAAQAALRAHLQGSHADMSLPRALALLEARQNTRTRQAARQTARQAEHGASPEPDILDIYLAVILRWCALYPAGGTGWFDLARYPALRAMATALEQRPAVARAMIAEGLGPTPFTAPRLATPPEGSAT